MKKIKIRNICRRPITLRVPGKSIRLAYRESAEIPESNLETNEVKKLFLRRFISVLPEKKKEPAKDKAEAKIGKEEEVKVEEAEAKIDKGKEEIKVEEVKEIETKKTPSKKSTKAKGRKVK